MSGPGKLDGTSREFAEHASVEAIDVQLKRAHEARDRWDRHIRKLTALRAERLGTVPVPSPEPSAEPGVVRGCVYCGPGEGHVSGCPRTDSEEATTECSAATPAPTPGEPRPGDAACDSRDAHGEHEWPVMGRQVRCRGVDVSVARTRRPISDDYAESWAAVLNPGHPDYRPLGAEPTPGEPR